MRRPQSAPDFLDETFRKPESEQKRTPVVSSSRGSSRCWTIAACFVLTTLFQADCLHEACAQTPVVAPLPASLATRSEAVTDDLTLEPYWVYVAREKAYARCGPNDDYYRTDPLRHGQKLEVYAETKDGWLGIRPPDGSFCWIPADALQLGDSQETGTIIEDRTVAWIGTQLGRARSYRWQVQLAKGEPVTIVGRSEREGPHGPQLWFRIVPPSGEYRWVHRDQVVGSSEELVASMRDEDSREVKGRLASDRASRSSAAGRRTSRQEQPSVVARSGQSILAGQEPIGSGLKREVQNNQTPAYDSAESRAIDAMNQGGSVASVEFLSRPKLLEIGNAPAAPTTEQHAGDSNWVVGATRAGGPAGSPIAVSTLSAPIPYGGVQQVSSQQSTAPRAGVSPTGGWQTNPSSLLPTHRPTIVSAERIAQIEAETRGADFDQLSLIFSRLMAAQATAAETEPVERAARTLASSATDIVIAGRARLLAERAEQYRRVANRRDGDTVIRSTHTPAIPAPAAEPGRVLQAGYADSINAQPMPQAAPGSSQSGYLVQVYSARKHSPPFALTDNTGRTVAYVTPAPGVNLRVHLNSKVTVNGNPGFLTGLNTPHILVTEAFRTPEP